MVTPAHIVTTMDFADIVAQHEASGADISMVYQHITNADTTYIGCDYLRLKGDRVTEVKENKGNQNERNISLETYVINRDVLIKLLKQASSISAFFNLKDTLAYLCDEKVINAIEYKGYARIFDSTPAYFKNSLEFLDLDVFSQVFKSNWPIFTNTNDTPPTKYKTEASVKSSIIANGAVIDGQVENSIIARNVTIGKDAVVKNCILLSGSKVAANAVLENVIMDKEAKVEMHTELSGTYDDPLYIKEGDIV